MVMFVCLSVHHAIFVPLTAPRFYNLENLLRLKLCTCHFQSSRTINLEEIGENHQKGPFVPLSPPTVFTLRD